MQSAPQVVEAADFATQRAAIVAARVRRCAVLDRVLAVLVVALAAVLALAPIRDSGIWVHLAAGRQLVSGTADTSPGPQWHDSIAPMRPGWLFDVACYAVYQTAGGVGLGILKLALAVGLAAGLLWAGWSRAGGWFAALGTGLGLLAVSPWLGLRPGVLSLLFLALTLGCLERRRAAGDGGRGRAWLALWPLLAMFIFWVNVDAWFLLGPGVLACYAAGEWFAGRRGASARVPPAAAIVGVLVCLANPQMAGAFRWPPALLLHWHGAALGDDPVFRPVLISPLSQGYLMAGPLWSAAGLALGLLLAMALFALLLNRAGRSGVRLVICAGLLGLGLYQAQLLPLLAAALAALVPRGLAEWAEARHVDGAVGELRLRQAVTGRAGTVVAAVVVLALAAIGLLPGPAPIPRGCGIVADPSLQRIAEALATWRQDGTLGPRSRGFCYAPDIADYFAWYCPAEGTVADCRQWLSPRAADEIAVVRRGLAGIAPARSQSGRSRRDTGDWRAVLRAAGVDHVVLADLDGQRVQAVLQHVCAAPEEWTVLMEAGRARARLA